MEDMDVEMLADFLVEALEQCEILDQELVALEDAQRPGECLNSIFRIMHTLKGGAGFMSLHKLERLAHRAESLLDGLRGGQLAVDRKLIDLLLEVADALREILACIETNGNEGESSYQGLIDRLESFTLGSVVSPDPAGEVTIEEAPPSAEEAEIRALERLQAELLNSLEPPRPQPVSISEEAPDAESHGRGGGNHVRVKVELLDKLMNLVGELVLSRNQMLQLAPSIDNVSLTSASQRINLVTSELQEYVMQTRMQPVGVVLKKFPRLVRDLASQTGKEVRLTIEGEETALDRTVIEAIKDPLTHVLRNSIDHGLESPEDRKAAGKPVQGTIHIKAHHEGGQVTIEFLDDGRGIDPNKVRERAIERGFLSRHEAQNLSERDTLRLVFRPGFSTAGKVTNLSGRGVGMDVVQSSTEKIGGSVELQSVVGKGTMVKLRIPLTLAIIPALIVHEAGQRYAIPQVNLQELVRLDGEGEFDRLQGAEIYRLRGRLLPILRLHQILGLEPTDRRETSLVVLTHESLTFGLVVDGVCDTEEIVVKPLGSELKQLQLFAGATIMGDGRVALILDVGGLVRNANMKAELEGQAMGQRTEIDSQGSADSAMLVFTLGGSEPFAVPLSLVSRLEEFAADVPETLSGGLTVVQYRDSLLSLFNLADMLPCQGGFHNDPLQVLVFERGGLSLGLVVDRIVDVIEERLSLHRTGNEGHGVLGLAVLGGKATSIVDLEAVITSIKPEWFSITSSHQSTSWPEGEPTLEVMRSLEGVALVR